MVYNKIKYVFRQDSSSRWVEEQIKRFKENPDDPQLACLTRLHNLTIVSINPETCFTRYKKEGYPQTQGIDMDYYMHTAVIMEDGTVFYDMGGIGPNKQSIRAAFYDYCEYGKMPEWAETDTDYIELDDIVL